MFHVKHHGAPGGTETSAQCAGPSLRRPPPSRSNRSAEHRGCSRDGPVTRGEGSVGRAHHPTHGDPSRNIETGRSGRSGCAVGTVVATEPYPPSVTAHRRLARGQARPPRAEDSRSRRWGRGRRSGRGPPGSGSPSGLGGQGAVETRVGRSGSSAHKRGGVEGVSRETSTSSPTLSDRPNPDRRRGVAVLSMSSSPRSWVTCLPLLQGEQPRTTIIAEECCEASGLRHRRIDSRGVGATHERRCRRAPWFHVKHSGFVPSPDAAPPDAR